MTVKQNKYDSFSSNNIKKYLKKKINIFDVGSGPTGSYWWKYVDKDAEIVGIDSMFFPKKLPKNVKIYRMDANKLVDINNNFETERYKTLLKRFAKEKVDWVGKFDMVVANHVLEHVESPKSVIKGIFNLLKKGGIVYVGFPESTNFTDTFYHLIHPEGGGHIQKLTKDSVYKLFRKNKFDLIACNVWPDDWLWFQKLYDYKGRDIKYINQKEIDFMVDVFRKELTPKKGYFYGWEMVFKKT